MKIKKAFLGLGAATLGVVPAVAAVACGGASVAAPASPINGTTYDMVKAGELIQERVLNELSTVVGSKVTDPTKIDQTKLSDDQKAKLGEIMTKGTQEMIDGVMAFIKANLNKELTFVNKESTVKHTFTGTESPEEVRQIILPRPTGTQ